MMEELAGLTYDDVVEVFGEEWDGNENPVNKVLEDQASGRFGCTSREELEEDLENRIPKNTKDKAKWAMNTYQKWLFEWRLRIDDIPKVLKPIEEFTPNDLDHTLQYFFCDARKVNGERYPPQTLKEIAASIKHYFNNMLKWNMSIFLDKEFKISREALDSQMKKNAALGLAKPRKRAAVIEYEEEEELWKKGKFGRSNPEQLLHTLLYHLGLHLSLRACQEHRDLIYGDQSQIQLITDYTGEYLLYTERISKNHTFGLKHSRMEPKQTRIYSLPEDPGKCVVSLYKDYVSHRPEAHNLRGHNAFYLSCKRNPKGPVWYNAMPLGVHSIQKVTKQLFSMSDPKKYITNSSLRRTVTNRLISSGINKEVIQKKTGRVSEAANAAYIEASSHEKRMSAAIYKRNDDADQPRTSTISIRSNELPSQTSNNAVSNTNTCSFQPTFNNCTVTINNYYNN